MSVNDDYMCCLASDDTYTLNWCCIDELKCCGHAEMVGLPLFLASVGSPPGTLDIN